MKNQTSINLSFVKWLLLIFIIFILFHLSYNFTEKQLFNYNSFTINNTTTESTISLIPLEIDKTLIASNINLNTINNFLQLVNSDYPNNSDLEQVTVSAFKVVPVLSISVDIHPIVLDSIVDLFNDATNSGFKSFLINYGYRGYEEQKLLYDNATDKSFVSKPGYSEHHTGLAVDIAYKGITGKQMGKSKEGKWLAKNAWKYGFILRYPNNKTDITKISYEPWHFRYVGLPHSYYISENNLCLEEYIQFLKSNGEYTLELNGVKYFVYYQTPQDDVIYLPKNLQYEISCDNTGGFIITAKED